MLIFKETKLEYPNLIEFMKEFISNMKIGENFNRKDLLEKWNEHLQDCGRAGYFTITIDQYRRMLTKAGFIFSIKHGKYVVLDNKIKEYSLSKIIKRSEERKYVIAINNSGNIEKIKASISQPNFIEKHDKERGVIGICYLHDNAVEWLDVCEDKNEIDYKKEISKQLMKSNDVHISIR